MGLISNGTTIFDNGSMASGFGSSLKFISKATASTSSSIEFTSGIDSSYNEYIFYFVSMHPSTDLVSFQFNMSTDGGSNYNITKTSTFFRAFHTEDDTSNSFQYYDSDLAQSTSDQILCQAGGNANDEGVSGFLHLFNPSSTTFVKNFIATGLTASLNETQQQFHTGGYGNTTSAVNAVKFQMSSGTIDSGDIILFGVN